MKQAVRTKWRNAQDMLQSVYGDGWDKIKSSAERGEKRILETHFQRLRLPLSGIPAPGDFLTLDCGASWLNQDVAHQTITYLIKLDCAHLCIESFPPPPLISLFHSPLPAYENLCLHWDVEMELETWVPHLPDGQDLNKPLCISTCFLSIAFHSSKQPGLHLVALASSRWTPEMLLNIPQCTGNLPPPAPSSQ